VSEDVEAVIEVAAPRERVWRAVTEPALVAEWMGCLRFQPAPGQLFYMQPDRELRARDDVTGAIVCRLQILDPPRRLAFSWVFPDNPETWVDLRLRRIPGGTHVKLTHASRAAGLGARRRWPPLRTAPSRRGSASRGCRPESGAASGPPRSPGCRGRPS